MTTPDSVKRDQEEKLKSRMIGTQGIIKLHNLLPRAALFGLVPNTNGGIDTIYCDSWPSDDEVWTPPLHGDDIASSSDNLLQKLDEQRYDFTQFTRILGADGFGCSSLEKEFLLCFEDEKQLPQWEIRSGNPHAFAEGQQTSEPAIKLMPSMKSFVAAFFPSNEQGFLFRPSTEELERCLDKIPQCKLGFKDLNDEAVKAVKSCDWEKACKTYEEWLVLLENMENSIRIHIQTLLFLWVCIPLIHIYHLRLGNYLKCVKTNDRMLQQLIRHIEVLHAHDQKVIAKLVEDEDESNNKNGDEDDAPILLYYTILWHRRLALFEWSYTIFEKDGNQLLANYVRFKVFNKVKVQKIHHYGFLQLQQMVNFWGRRSPGCDGDMRVALCFNLEHLHRQSNQHSKAEYWRREKWRWISDETHHQYQQWNLKLEDIMSLFTAGMEEEARRLVSELTRESEKPRIVSHTLNFWTAKLDFEESNRSRVERSLKNLKRDLEFDIANKKQEASMDKSFAAQASKLLVIVQYELSKLESAQREAKMLDYSPFGVEMIHWSDADKHDVWCDAKDINVLTLMEDNKRSNVWKQTSENFGPSYPGFLVLNMIHGRQSINSLGKRFSSKEIETYRDR